MKSDLSVSDPLEWRQQLVTTLILLHKDYAERYAYELELQAWKDSETAEQGKWRRVRREIKRRNKWPHGQPFI